MTKQHAAAFAKLKPGTVAHQEHEIGIRRNEPVIVMMEAFLLYAERHQKRFESKLSEDYVLGPEWMAGIQGVRGLLNGEGDFDGGTVESLFWSALEAAGYTESDL